MAIVLKKELDIPVEIIDNPNAQLDGGDVLFTGNLISKQWNGYTYFGNTALSVVNQIQTASIIFPTCVYDLFKPYLLMKNNRFQQYFFLIKQVSLK